MLPFRIFLSIFVLSSIYFGLILFEALSQNEVLKEEDPLANRIKVCSAIWMISIVACILTF